MKPIDSHCHLHYQPWNSEDICKYQIKTKFLLNIATNGQDSKEFIINNFTPGDNPKIFHWNNTPFIGYSVGFHPCHNEKIFKKDMMDMAMYAMAIGEIGFDNLPTSPSQDIQIHNFHQQMALAMDYDIPVLIHCRDSWDLFFKETINYKNHPMILHSFTGDKLVAENLLHNYNCWISISGIITYNKVDNIKEALINIPLDRLLIETDSPFLVPYYHRKNGEKYNNPCFLDEIIAKISVIKSIDHDEIINATNNNFIKIFGLQDILL